MKDKTLTIRIMTSEGMLHEGTASAVFLPGQIGPFEVLPNHAPIISALSAGPVRMMNGGKEQRIDVGGGVVRVLDNVITVCAEME
ncbi:MAG: F0F1 ATP synthase subunit epsilon [Bacteroidales bacterium]|jgi:F-type H+-transporting ATPase subunit epsilon|nr:F0F1 ATP synthase subunit epsilon [Bacteroidales bacterium]